CTDSSRSGSGKTTTSPAENYYLARRRTLQVVVSSLLTECGFESAEKAAVESLTEMIQSYISEVGRSAKSYCEHTARSTPTLSDVVVTLIEMGFNVDTLPTYAKRSQRMVITARECVLRFVAISYALPFASAAVSITFAAKTSHFF
uniref:Transcription initiation factor TFIID subunit 8 n=1 Tax=Scleropages formosus TaxID=113540 RepID=A0A8D0CE26_SCLFO